MIRLYLTMLLYRIPEEKLTNIKELSSPMYTNAIKRLYMYFHHQKVHKAQNSFEKSISRGSKFHSANSSPKLGQGSFNL